MMSTLTFHALQPPTLPRQSVLMQPMTIMILTDQWISTRSVNLRDFADQGPLTDMDMEELEDAEMFALLSKHMPVRTVQEAVAAGNLHPLDADAANVFSRSKHILQEHVGKHNTNAAEI